MPGSRSGPVLLIEDNPVSRKVMRLWLEDAGHRVVDAPDGETGLALARSERPALVVVDIRLPGIDGFEMLRQLRKVPGCTHLPVIAATGNPAVAQTATFAQPDGFAEVLIKPVDPLRMVRTVEAHLAAREPPAIPGRRRVLLVDDEPIQRKLVQVHLVDWGFQVTTATNGAEALDRARATPPDVIVSDLLMPEMDGMSLSLAVRRDPALATLPLVLVSSLRLDEIDATLAQEAGATRVVGLSAGMDELHDALTAVCSMHPLRGAPLDPTLPDRVERRGREFQERVQARAALRDGQAASESLLSFFQRFSDVAAVNAKASSPLAHLLAGYLDAAGAPVGVGYLWTAGKGLKLGAQIGYPDAAAHEVGKFFGQLGLLRSVAEHGHRVEDPAAHLGPAELASLLLRANVRSMLLVPLAIEADTVGVIVVGLCESPVSAAQIRLAEAVRGPIAQAIGLSRSHAALVSSREAFRGVADNVSDGLIAVDSTGVISYANPAAVAMLGLNGPTAAPRRIQDVLPFVGAEPGTYSGVGLDPDRKEVPMSVRAESNEYGGTPGRLLILRDFSVARKLDELASLADHDALTGLFNRRRFDAHLAMRLAEAQRYGWTGALALIDLNRFKFVNDSLGHPAGDAVLRAVAHHLSGQLRATDLAFRIGRDEFAIELPHATLIHAIEVVRRILRAIGTPIPWHTGPLQVTAAAGIAMYLRDADTVDALFAVADAALYRAKAHAGGIGGVSAICTAGGIV